jgi:hypothetical protein
MFLEPPWDDEIIKLPVFTTEDIHPRSRECDKIEAVSKPRMCRRTAEYFHS